MITKIQFNNGEFELADVLGKVVTLSKSDKLCIKDRFLRGEGDGIFKCGTLKTKAKALKKFTLIMEEQCNQKK